MKWSCEQLLEGASGSLPGRAGLWTMIMALLLSGCATVAVRNRLPGSPPAGLYPATRADLNGTIFSWRSGRLRPTGNPNAFSRIALAGLDLPFSLFIDTIYFPTDIVNLIVAPEYTRKWTVETTSPGERPSGLCRIYDAGNRLIAEGLLEAGKMDGTWMIWTARGDKTCELSYRRGIRNGPVKMWYGSLAPEARGRLKLEGTFLNGLYNGPVTAYYPSGVRRSLRVYEHGELKSCQLWAPDGTAQTPEAAQTDAARILKADMEYAEAIEYSVTASLTHAHRRISP